MEQVRNLGALAGRFMLAFIFVVTGIDKLMAPAGTMKLMASVGLPHAIIPELLIISIIVELAGGILLIAGWHAEWVALIIFLWCIPVTVLFHVIPGQTLEWYKNMAFMGGLLMVAVNGAGGFSVDSARGSRIARSSA